MRATATSLSCSLLILFPTTALCQQVELPETARPALSLEESEVPAFLCFTAILRRGPEIFVAAEPRPAPAEVVWELSPTELRALDQSRAAWLESEARIGAETAARCDDLGALGDGSEEVDREAFRQLQLEGNRRKVHAAFDALRILEQSWDARSLEKLRETVDQCKGIAFSTGGERFEEDEMEIYRSMDARFGKKPDE